MSENANGPGAIRTAAGNCFNKYQLKYSAPNAFRQVTRVVGVFLETYANRQIALRQIGRGL